MSGSDLSGQLRRRIAEQLSAPVHPSIADFAGKLAREAGAPAALFYGSNLRTGELEGVLDFYLLMDGPQKERIWPRVSYHEAEVDGTMLRAKVATMSLGTFHSAAAGELRDTTIWARFVQPSALVFCTAPAISEKVELAIHSAMETASLLAAALGPRQGTEADFWKGLFQATYKAEFRVEKAGREDSILSLNRRHFDGLFPAALQSQSIAFSRDGDALEIDLPPQMRGEVLGWWKKRQRLGKLLNLIRLIKASTTFEGAARYAAWKIERHTGVKVEVTPWREKHPLLAAPSVMFKVWRSRRQA